MLKKLVLSSALVLMVLLVAIQVAPAVAVMPSDCDEFISGGAQGNALGCIDMVIFLYEGAGPWDGTWETGGHGTWPPI